MNKAKKSDMTCTVVLENHINTVAIGVFTMAKPEHKT